MYKFILFSFFTALHSLSNAAIISKSVKDFGAKGDGVTNDHDAFVKAAQFINQSKRNIRLLIPYGTYIIGAQKPSNRYYLEGIDLLALDHVENVTIEGTSKNGKRPILKYSNSLYYGTFYNDGPLKGQPICEPKKGNFNTQNAAFIGACFQINYCKNIEIKNIELDGNQQNMVIGGYFGDVGRQLNHRGIYITQSNATKVYSVYAHHFALDGVEVAVSNNTKINNLVSEYNGRQGLSWIAGDTLIISNSKFSYTGCSKIMSQPCAGLDIEPEGGQDIRYGRFTNCEFSFNQGCGIVNNRQKHKARDLLFEKCTFIGFYNWAIWVSSHKTRFNNCTIYGQITHAIHASESNSNLDFTTFYQCKFNNVYKNQFTYKQTNFLFELNDERVLLDNCTIYAQNIGFLYHGNHNKSALPSEIRNSTVIIDNTFNSQIATEGLSIFASKFYWVDKISSNLNLIQNENNQYKKLPQKQVSAMIPMAEKGIKPFSNNVRNFDCSSNK